MNDVCKNILLQMGGNKFLAMVNSKLIQVSSDTLGIRFKGSQHGWNHVEIKLTSDDLYDVTFYKIKRDMVKRTHRGIYCNQLQELFTQTTGLHTTL